MKLPVDWNEASPGGMATNANPVYGGIVDRQRGDGSWFIVFNDEDLGPIESLESREAAFGAFQEALHAAIADRMALYANLVGTAIDSVSDCLSVRLKEEHGSTDKAGSIARSKAKAMQDLPLAEQIKAALDGGVSADRLASSIWGVNATWISVRKSYDRSAQAISAEWERAGFEVISTGGGYWAAAITVQGVNFFLSDYSESRAPNPDYPLLVAGYKAETGDYLDFSKEVENLQDALEHLASWAESLQPKLLGAGMDGPRKTKGHGLGA